MHVGAVWISFGNEEARQLSSENICGVGATPFCGMMPPSQAPLYFLSAEILCIIFADKIMIAFIFADGVTKTPHQKSTAMSIIVYAWLCHYAPTQNASAYADIILALHEPFAGILKLR